VDRVARLKEKGSLGGGKEGVGTTIRRGSRRLIQRICRDGGHTTLNTGRTGEDAIHELDVTLPG
jgi:hypothetical protein